jgi:hypothetical protein
MNQVAAQLTRSADEPENDAKYLGPYAKVAETLWHAGLAPIPVGGEDGKKPLVTSFTKWRRRPSLDTIRRWIAKYPVANI